MKKNIVLLLILIIAVFTACFFIYPESPVTAPVNGNDFLIGGMNSYDNMISQPYYDSAGFNLTHRYISTVNPGSHQYADPLKHSPRGNILNDDYLNTPVQTTELRNKANEISGTYNSRVFWHRPKIEWLYGACPALDAGDKAVFMKLKIIF